MERIILNEDHIKVIKQYLKGEVSNLGATEYKMTYLSEVIHMAEKRFNEYPEDCDDDGDLIKWFWNEYQIEQGNKNK